MAPENLGTATPWVTEVQLSALSAGRFFGDCAQPDNRINRNQGIEAPRRKRRGMRSLIPAQ